MNEGYIDQLKGLTIVMFEMGDSCRALQIHDAALGDAQLTADGALKSNRPPCDGNPVAFNSDHIEAHCNNVQYYCGHAV